MMHMKPPFSCPMRFSTGTCTSSIITSAVPAEDEYDVLIDCRCPQ
jgi:hypothetical protein